MFLAGLGAKGRQSRIDARSVGLRRTPAPEDNASL